VKGLSSPVVASRIKLTVLVPIVVGVAPVAVIATPPGMVMLVSFLNIKIKPLLIYLY